MASAPRPVDKPRPIYLNLLAIRQPIPAIVSILHRVSGALLFLVGLPLGLWSLQASLANVRALSERLGGKQGALSAMLGNEEDAKKVINAIDRANELLASLGGASRKLDRVLGKTEQRVFGDDGLLDGTQRAVQQANAILGDVRESLKKADRILADAQGASADLSSLRAEVDASLRKVAAPKFACRSPGAGGLRRRAERARLADECRAGAAILRAQLPRRQLERG